jgi:hypothetical protein
MLDTDNQALRSGYPSVRCLQAALTTFVQEEGAFVNDLIFGISVFGMIDPAGSWV